MPFSFLTLLIMLLAVGALLTVAAVWAMARMLLRPPRMTDGKALYLLNRLTPEDVGLQYEACDFEVETDGVSIKVAGWWVPCPGGSEKACVILHGYADGKVGGIAWGPTWVSLGFNVLAIDLRAHGESGGSDSTAGYHERHDVRQVLDQLKRDRPAECEEIVLFGVSLGAAVAVAAAEGRDDIAALVLDCPFADYRNAVDTWAARMKMPLPGLRPWVVRWAERMAGADFAAVRPVDLVPKLSCPALVIQSGDDSLVLPPDREAMRAVAADYNLVEDARHCMGLATDAEAYRGRIGGFLARALSDAAAR